MGRHKNNEQNAILLEFMERNPDIAKGFVRGDKVRVEEKWKDVTETLNGAGPPTKDVNGWKRAWCDWKCDVRRKLAHNKSESRATGGGSFNKFTLSDMDEGVARVSGLFTVVEGITNSQSFGVNDSLNETLEDNGQSTSRGIVTTAAAANKRRIETTNDNETPTLTEQTHQSSEDTTQSSRTTSSSRRSGRRREPSFQQSVKCLMKTENKNISKIEIHLSKIAKSHNENNRKIRKSLENLDSHIKEIKNMFKKHHENIKKVLHEKNSIKKRLLEIEELRLDAQQLRYE